MSWGIELWDQYDNLALHTQKGIEFLERYGQFIKDRCNLEFEYSSKLRRLVKSYQPKKKDEEEYQFSSSKAFVFLLNESNDLAGQHELIGENLTLHIVKKVTDLVKELKEERKRHLQSGAKLQAALQVSLAHLEKTKKNYEKAFKEAEKAQENFLKADADLNLSRAEVEKARQTAANKTQISEDFKVEYFNQLQKTNQLQKQHFTELMPQVFQDLQSMDERRTIYIQDFIRQVATDHREVLPIITTCLDEISNAADTIDPSADSQIVIEKYKSGFSPPEDIPFVDLAALKQQQQNSDTNSTSNCSGVSMNKRDTLKGGTFNSGKTKKRGGLFGIFGSKSGADGKEDYSDLPPNQRKKKLQHKVNDIANQIQQETATRDGLMKMKGVYEQNPLLGDPLAVEAQLVESATKLDNLHQLLNKYKGYLSEVEGRSLTPTTQGGKTRSSISEESLSSGSTDAGTRPGQPPPLPLGRNSRPDTDDEFDTNGREFDPEPLPVLGTARALYAFDGQSEGSVPMKEGDEFEVVELDQGDGWTRIRRPNLEEGFVPTTYIECTLYSNG